MKIIPLSKEKIEDAIVLTSKVFPSDVQGENPPERGLRLSLSSGEYGESWASITKGNKITRLNYWVLLDDNTDKVIGVTGIYSFYNTQSEAWLGWFCVDPEVRGKGLGRKLLEWTMSKAKDEGYSVFRLYTSTDPDEAVAQNLYDSLGLKITQKEKAKGSQYDILYRQCNLI